MYTNAVLACRACLQPVHISALACCACLQILRTCVQRMLAERCHALPFRLLRQRSCFAFPNPVMHILPETCTCMWSMLADVSCTCMQSMLAVSERRLAYCTYKLLTVPHVCKRIHARAHRLHANACMHACTCACAHLHVHSVLSACAYLHVVLAHTNMQRTGKRPAPACSLSFP